MKKITIQEFAKQLRERYPDKFKNLSDVDLVSKWVKIRPSSVEALEYNERAKLILDDALRYTQSEIEKLRGKKKTQTPKPQPAPQPAPQPSPQPTDSTTQNKPTPPEEKTVTTNYVTKYASTQNPKKAFTWKPCDENTYPWTYGCKNTKIGQMNLSLFGDRYGDIFGDELMNALESYGYFGGPNEKNGQISKTIYDKVTVRDAQQQNESFNKKVVKETVKKVLKERLNKK